MTRVVGSEDPRAGADHTEIYRYLEQLKSEEQG